MSAPSSYSDVEKTTAAMLGWSVEKYRQEMALQRLLEDVPNSAAPGSRPEPTAATLITQPAVVAESEKHFEMLDGAGRPTVWEPAPISLAELGNFLSRQPRRTPTSNDDVKTDSN